MGTISSRDRISGEICSLPFQVFMSRIRTAALLGVIALPIVIGGAAIERQSTRDGAHKQITYLFAPAAWNRS